MTSTTTTDDQKAAWAAAAAVSAENQKPADPPPRRFVEKLPVALGDRERFTMFLKAGDLRKQVASVREDLKTYLSKKKAELKEQEAQIDEFEDAARTGRVSRDVACEEHISFTQNRKWTVRLDTNEQLNESPLSASDRQLLLHPDDPEDGQLSLADIGSSDLDDSEDGDDSEDIRERETIPPPSFDDTDVTDPDALMDAATKGFPDSAETKMARKGKK